jgi:hypothetical protein
VQAVGVDGLGAEEKRVADLLAALALDDQEQDLAFARRQLGERQAGAGMLHPL